MPRCDMCGKETGLIVASVEGTELNVCEECAKFGKIIRRMRPEIKAEKKKTSSNSHVQEITETELVIVNGYGTLIKNAREKKGLTQEDFAKKINEKSSLVHTLESEHREPSIKVAEKIGKFLNIKIVEEIEIEPANIKSQKSENLTIGDLIKLKK